MKTVCKRILACVAFCAIVLFLIGQLNDILILKSSNRYYTLEKMIEESDTDYDLQIYGSCHAYTSFDAKHFQDSHNISAYVFANPGEIIPATYLRMKEHFKQDVPTVALVEIWGVNAYETYTDTEYIFDYYLPPNIELLPLSFEKLNLISKYDSLDLVNENFPIAKYKDRILNMDLHELDFDYFFSEDDLYYYEMNPRYLNNGFLPNKWTRHIYDFYTRQPYIAPEDMLAIEDDIMEYIDKIIALCEQHDVKLIFYRVPYVSTANELRKANWFANYCNEKGIQYFDLEKEIEFDLAGDFQDSEHLNKYGAGKVTDFLSEHILTAFSSAENAQAPT